MNRRRLFASLFGMAAASQIKLRALPPLGRPCLTINSLAPFIATAKQRFAAAEAFDKEWRSQSLSDRAFLEFFPPIVIPPQREFRFSRIPNWSED